MAFTNVTLKKPVNGIVTELYPKSSTQAIMDIKTGEKLSNILASIIESIGKKTDDEEFQKIQTAFNNLIAEVPEEYNTLAKIAIAFTKHLEEYATLEDTVSGKVDAEDGKSLIETELIEKVKALYTKSEIDKKFDDLKKELDERLKLEYTDVDDNNGIITIV